MKRTLAIILSAVMLFTALPLTVFAEDAACEHTEFTWIYIAPEGADCTKDENIVRDKVCLGCGETLIEGEQIPLQEKHNLKALPLYDEDGKVIAENYTAPTCIKPGMQAYECQFCKTIVVNTIPAKGHSYDERVIHVKCFDPEDISTQVNRSEKGIYRYYCTEPDCDYYVEERINDHVHYGEDGKEPDCFGPGSTPYIYCVTCGSETEVTEIPQLTHKDENEDGRCDLCFSTAREDGEFCSCICHSENAFVQLFMPILKLIWQLLGIDNCHGTCEAVHYVKE